VGQLQKNGQAVSQIANIAAFKMFSINIL